MILNVEKQWIWDNLIFHGAKKLITSTFSKLISKNFEKPNSALLLVQKRVNNYLLLNSKSPLLLVCRRLVITAAWILLLGCHGNILQLLSFLSFSQKNISKTFLWNCDINEPLSTNLVVKMAQIIFTSWDYLNPQS